MRTLAFTILAALCTISFAQEDFSDCAIIINEIAPTQFFTYSNGSLKEIPVLLKSGMLNKGDTITLNSREIRKIITEGATKYNWKILNPEYAEFNNERFVYHSIRSNAKGVDTFNLDAIVQKKLVVQQKGSDIVFRTLDNTLKVCAFISSEYSKKYLFNSTLLPEREKLKQNFNWSKSIVFEQKRNMKKDFFIYHNVKGIEFDKNKIYLLTASYNSHTKEVVNEKNYLRISSLDGYAYFYDCYKNVWQGRKDGYEAFLKSKFTDREIDAIKKYQIFIGMNEEAMYYSIGEPKETNETVVEGLSHKQCVYGDGIFIYVENGKVSAFQNIESLKNLF